MKDFGTAAILCGGKSSRMGFDKCKIEIKGKLLIEIITEELKKVFEEVILISNDKEKFDNIKFTVIEDMIPNSGPMGGIFTALNHSSSRYVFITACDMPIINLKYIKYMIELIKDQRVEGVAAYNSGYIEPLYAFYSVDMLSNFKSELERNNFKLLDVMRLSSMCYVKEEKVREYSRNMSVFINLNYQSDLTFLERTFMEE